jgi:hypothetical protein
LVLDCLLVVNTVSRAIWVWKPQGSPDWIASLVGLCCLPVWFSPVTAMRIGVLPFWGGYADWGSDEDEDKESKTILHPSSSSDNCHDSESRTKARSFLALAFFSSSSSQRVTRVVFE